MSHLDKDRVTEFRRQADELHRRVMERFDNMSDRDKTETFVRAGILNEEGELTKPFGGRAEPSPRRRKLPGEK